MASTDVKLSHGAGAKEMWEFIQKHIVSKVPRNLWKTVNGYGLDILDDGAVIKVGDNYIVVSVDSYTVNPIFFKGGNIGELAVSGTLNDLVMMGAKPIAFMDTIVVEEGFPTRDLEIIVESMVKILSKESIPLIGGDFKVMPKGSIDRVVITGVGIGFTAKPIIDKMINEGDKIIVTGPIAEHGAVIMAHQLGMEDEIEDLRSDTKPLTRTVLPVIEKFKEHIHAARDPTRGGLAATLHEWIFGSDLAIIIDRNKIPIRDSVRFFLDALGIDPLNMASEGIGVLAVEPSVADDVVEELRRLGEKYAGIIGRIVRVNNPLLRGKVIAITEVGGKVIVEPRSVNLPRIC